MKRILVVDDNAMNRDILRRFLGKRGYAVETAASGSEGLSAIRTSPPDLVLLDNLLPDMRGDRLLREIRADRSTAGIPCVLMSGTDRSDLPKTYEADGCRDYVPKPIDFGNLLAVLEHCLDVGGKE